MELTAKTVTLSANRSGFGSRSSWRAASASAAALWPGVFTSTLKHFARDEPYLVVVVVVVVVADAATGTKMANTATSLQD